MAPSVKVDGALIRKMREEHGWERKEFAALIGVSANRVYKIEMLTQSTRPLTLRRIAAVLGVRPQELVVSEAAVN